MKLRAKLLAATAALLLCAGASAQSGRDEPLDGTTLHDWLNSPSESLVLAALVYIETVRSAYLFLGPSLAKSTDKQVRDIPCIPREIPNAQVNDVVRKYLQGDPAARPYPAFLTASKALSLAWPCPVRK